MFKRHCLTNQKYFLKFLLHFCNLHKILRSSKKKISFIASIFCRLLGARNVVTWMPEGCCFRTPLESQRVQRSQTLLKSTPHHFHRKFLLIQDKLSQRTSLFVRSEILGFFGNRLTADHMYSRHNWEKFLQHVQTPLSSETDNVFGNFYSVFGSYVKLCASSKKTSAS